MFNNTSIVIWWNEKYFVIRACLMLREQLIPLSDGNLYFEDTATIVVWVITANKCYVTTTFGTVPIRCTAHFIGENSDVRLSSHVQYDCRCRVCYFFWFKNSNSESTTSFVLTDISIRKTIYLSVWSEMIYLYVGLRCR